MERQLSARCESCVHRQSDDAMLREGPDMPIGERGQTGDGRRCHAREASRAAAGLGPARRRLPSDLPQHQSPERRQLLRRTGIGERVRKLDSLSRGGRRCHGDLSAVSGTDCSFHRIEPTAGKRLVHGLLTVVVQEEADLAPERLNVPFADEAAHPAIDGASHDV